MIVFAHFPKGICSLRKLVRVCAVAGVMTVLALIATPNEAYADLDCLGEDFLECKGKDFLKRSAGSYYMNDYPYQGFGAMVESVSDYGDILFKGRSHFHRLFGVDPDPKFLREFIEGKYLYCSILAEYRSFMLNKTVIWRCYFPTPKNATGGMTLAEYLVNTGHGREFCVESKNAFGTCE